MVVGIVLFFVLIFGLYALWLYTDFQRIEKKSRKMNLNI